MTDGPGADRPHAPAPDPARAGGGDDGAFGRRGARWLAAIAGLSLVASAVLATFADLFEVPSFQADAFSRSAIGHHALVQLLRELGFTVVVSRSRTAEQVSGDAVLVLAEPGLPDGDADPGRRDRAERMLEAASRVLLVLPKREGAPDPLRPRWLGSGWQVGVAEARRALDLVDVPGKVVRPTHSVADWRGPLPAPALDAPQLLAGSDLAPLVESGAGMLAGERTGDGQHLVVLADPDVLATHGIAKGDDAILVVRLLERLGAGPGGAAVVFDETLHGNEVEPALARELLRWPLVLATIQAALVLALLAWAALVRFGRPRRAPSGLAAGKALLLDNTADLLRHGGHVAPALAAYWRASKEAVAHALRPPGDASADLDRWLAGHAAARDRGVTLDALERRVAALPTRGGEDEALRVAIDIQRFREEMTHGAGKHP